MVQNLTTMAFQCCSIFSAYLCIWRCSWMMTLSSRRFKPKQDRSGLLLRLPLIAPEISCDSDIFLTTNHVNMQSFPPGEKWHYAMRSASLVNALELLLGAVCSTHSSTCSCHTSSERKGEREPTSTCRNSTEMQNVIILLKEISNGHEYHCTASQINCTSASHRGLLAGHSLPRHSITNKPEPTSRMGLL